jgi:hypothetical protein
MRIPVVAVLTAVAMSLAMSPAAAQNREPEPRSGIGTPWVRSAAPSASSGLPPGGQWELAFEDTFTGGALDTTRWEPNWYAEGGEMNNVPTYADNVEVRGGADLGAGADGALVLTLESENSGALVHSDVEDGYRFPVGSYVEASVRFPGNGEELYNWPAWWVSTDDDEGHPAAGEHDIAEVLSDGSLSVNYHSPSGAHNQGAVPGYWGDAYHRFGVHRQPGWADVYWDGELVAGYKTDDSGNPEILIFNVGVKADPQFPAYGADSQVVVDWLRAYDPAAP